MAPAKPFDEAVDDAGDDFESVWETAEDDEDRMYIVSRMMNELPSQALLASSPQKKQSSLPFLSPGSPSPSRLPSTSDLIAQYEKQQELKKLATIKELQQQRSLLSSTPPGYSYNNMPSPNASPIFTPSTLVDASVNRNAIQKSNVVATPTSPDDIKPYALFNSAEKENIPPNHDDSIDNDTLYGEDDDDDDDDDYDNDYFSSNTPESEPGKLIPSKSNRKKRKSSRGGRHHNKTVKRTTPRRSSMGLS